MTLLVGWVAVDNRQTTSFYIVSDSRLSWDYQSKYDCGKKILALKNSPDLIAYCGDVLFPIITLHKIADKDRNQILFPSPCTNEEKCKIIYSEIENSFIGYPKQYIHGDIHFIHVTRQDKVDFLCTHFHWNAKTKWEIEKIELPSLSDKIFSLGTGASSFNKRYFEYLQKSDNANTSRCIFQCFCDWLSSVKDNQLWCGGVPQLIGLYNQGHGNDFGIIYENSRYFSGQEVLYKIGINLNKIKWVNTNFENCNGFTMKKYDYAQSQPNDMLKKK